MDYILTIKKGKDTQIYVFESLGDREKLVYRLSKTLDYHNIKYGNNISDTGDFNIDNISLIDTITIYEETEETIEEER